MNLSILEHQILVFSGLKANNLGSFVRKHSLKNNNNSLESALWKTNHEIAQKLKARNEKK